MILDIHGLLKGRRIRKCSADARWLYPYLLNMANGFARSELDFEIMADEFATFRDDAPSPNDLKEYFTEYETNHLIFPYESQGQRWCQWDTPNSYLKDYKTAVDMRSPSPPEPAYTGWLQDQHADDWPRFHWRKSSSRKMAAATDSEETADVKSQLDEHLAKSLPSVGQDLVLGGGVGVGEGEGEGRYIYHENPKESSKNLGMEGKGRERKNGGLKPPFNASEQSEITSAAEMIVAAHPRVGALQRAVDAAVGAILRESPKRGGWKPAADYLMKCTKTYAYYTESWPADRYKSGAETFFKERCYEVDPVNWWFPDSGIPKPPVGTHLGLNNVLKEQRI